MAYRHSSGFKLISGVADNVEAFGRADMLISSMAISSASTRSRSARGRAAVDELRMTELVAFTARSLKTTRPVPFGSSIVDTRSGQLLLSALNAVAREFDPSSHAEVRAIRLATKKLKSLSLAGYTLYTTCEPCPMCMSTALWAGLDRVVYGATIQDAGRHCRQVYIPATEVAERSGMRCKVDGPVLQDQCYGLFTHPNMLKAFANSSTRKEKTTNTFVR